MQSKVKAIISQNKRNKVRETIYKYMLLILMVLFVAEEFKTILTPRVVFIETVKADIESNIETEEPVLEVKDLIIKIAKEENFEDIDGLLRLSMCESTLGTNNFNQNYDKRKTKDRGIWMINDYWHSEVTDEQAYDNEWATKWTIRRIKGGYGHEWMCWPAFKDNSYKIN